VASQGSTRRDFLKIAGAAAGGAAAGVLGGYFLGTSVGRQATPTSVVNAYNWSYYIDENLLPKFTAETGIRVQYDTFESEDEVWTKISTGASGYDMVVLVDYRVGEAIAANLLLPLDAARLPNTEFLIEQFTAPGYDPTLAYSRPYFWGTTGIGFNTTRGTVTGWEEMFDVSNFLPAHDQKVSMIDDSRETIGAALFYLGYSPNTENPTELNEARDVLLAQKPFLAKYGGAADYMVSLVDGSWDVSHAWNGDIVVAQESNPDIAYVVPKEGAILWVDNMTIPRGARNVDGALRFIDFMMEPANQIDNALAAGYPSPSQVATDYLPADFKADPAIYPPADVLAKCEILGALSPTAEDLYNAIWLEVIT